ncbi:MAG TPA: lysophospholipid acyltransferase family protein [Myxococcales bacterium]|nr:lysophospholipid acyltransferase family protein [Myxococcales bacterium]
MAKSRKGKGAARDPSFGRTPAGGEVVEGAAPVGHTPGGGEVRRGRGAGSTPGGGEVHRVTTRPARAKKRRPPRADDEPDEEPARAGNGAAAEPEPELEVRPEPARPEAEVIPSDRDPLSPVGPAAAMVATAKTSWMVAKALASSAFSGARLGRALQAATAVGAAVRSSLGISGGAQVDVYGKDAELAEHLRPLNDFLYERYWRISVAGAEHVPEGGAILVGNHSGAIPVDGAMLSQALARERPDLPEARWLVEDQVFDTPFIGTLFNRIGAVRACPENALRLLEEKRPVIVFPEGVQGIGKPFQQRYQLKRLGRGGFAKLAVRAGLPIVPVAIVGAEEALPLLAKLPTRFLGLPYLPVTVPPLPSKWSIRFGEPLAPDSTGPAASEDPAVVQHLVDGTRGAIEGMLRAALDQRRSVFRG